jgi:hypothetical protein
VSTDATPACRTRADLEDHDGQRVRLVGTYRRRLSQIKMNSPKRTFLGYVDIELADGARVRLGTERRPEDEVERLTDARVVAEGRLELEPAGEPNVARRAPEPTLVEVDAVRAAEE